MDDATFKARFDGDYRARYEGASPTDFTALDFVGALGSVGDALLYARLFLPEFAEVDGMVFLKDTVDDAGGPEGIRKSRDQFANQRDCERSLNLFQIYLNFPNHLRESVEGDDRLLAEQLVNAWALRLRQLYPTRKFHVSVIEEDAETSVSFYQEP